MTKTYETKAKLVQSVGGTIPTTLITVNDRAATREAIFASLRKKGVKVETRSQWKAKPGKQSDGPDWDYKDIVIHHAGNSYSCSDDTHESLRRAEATDLKSFSHISYHYAIGCDGTVFEALDIREKGAHVEGANTGKIGIVFLANLSMPGEAFTYGPGVKEAAKKGIGNLVTEALGQTKNAFNMSWDTPNVPQLDAVDSLVKTLLEFFKVEKLGGHREYALQKNLHRACPGAHGLKIARNLRDRYGLETP
ncbi:hypothetical protein B0T49_12775 [Chromobacterium violaceum]|uniref:N-acetylmuramoyl-L-alanine amidase n=1 Tax=Chromobacterium violaceum TaxID=536 RepID=UPI0009DB2817|nr:N-acetylmuramoyl-L-alanine amidase [Chromobacterium violaceum]OQS47810.1 hypothetical protein B0T48_12060 [Chromobacterium violaceum]OQS49940.1 hypothetical protein B0T49_12775 [Chromobacterium violaceum]